MAAGAQQRVATSKQAGLSAQLTPIPCPCCSSPIRVPSLDVIVFHYGLSPFQARILEAVWRGRGLPVQAERVFDAMYQDDPDGGPTPAKMYAAFKEGLHRLRVKLDGSGIAVVSAGYRRGYRLVMGVAQKET